MHNMLWSPSPEHIPD